MVETACGVICACLPTLRPLAKRVSSKFGNSSGKSRGNNTLSHNPTELVTIGGSAQLASRSMTKSPFQRLDDDLRETHAAYNNSKEAMHARQHLHHHQHHGGPTPAITVNSTEYASSGDGNSVEDEAGRMRTNSHGQEQYGKGFV